MKSLLFHRHIISLLLYCMQCPMYTFCVCCSEGEAWREAPCGEDGVCDVTSLRSSDSNPSSTSSSPSLPESPSPGKSPSLPESPSLEHSPSLPESPASPRLAESPDSPSLAESVCVPITSQIIPIYQMLTSKQPYFEHGTYLILHHETVIP